MRGVAEAASVDLAARLVLVGDGPIRPELEALARQLDPSGTRFHFAGRVPLADIPRWLGAADVFALTSPNEGFSCSLLEAMSAGLPSVVSDIEANLQLVTHGEHGLTVPWNQPRAIGAALATLFADPALRARLGAAARQRVVENYSTEKVIARYEALFARAFTQPA
jgi:glycosyltransferase involved in cell wall biosynthesis